MSSYTISNNAISFIAGFEGFRAKKGLIGSTQEEDIGYGYALISPDGVVFNERRYWKDKTGKKIDLFNDTITKEQAKTLLLDTLNNKIPGVNIGIKRKLDSLTNEGVIQTQSQHDSLTSLLYATGTSEANSKLLRTVLYLLRTYKQDYYKGKDDIWTNGFNVNYRKNINDGLSGANTRRKAEYDLFFQGITENKKPEEEQIATSTNENNSTSTNIDNTPESNEPNIDKPTDAKSQFVSNQPDTIVIFDPTVKLEEIRLFDRGQLDGSEKTEYKAGNLSPIVKINDTLFQDTELQSFQLRYKGIVPELMLWIMDRSGFFTSQKTIPKDGDIASVYIKSEVTDIKPIRQDFRIINVNKIDGTGDVNGDNGVYVIHAILHIDINIPEDKHYEDNSNGVLQTVAKDLKLGFATNDLTLEDKMVWIRPLKNALWFIEHVMDKSYKNDDSFFNCFVDQWYYMNFIEINKKAKVKELDNGSIAFLSGTDFANDDPTQKEKMLKTEIFLSNSPVVMSTPMHIAEFKPFNDTGNFWATNGYVKELLYYRKDEQSGTQYQMDTLIGEPADNEKTLRGRDDEDHTTIKKYINLGVQINSNVHKNYFHADVQNKFNGDNVKKMGLRIKTSYPNLNVHRFDTIPIFIFNTTNIVKADLEKQENIVNKNSDSNTNNLDRVLSGFYLIVDVSYIFSSVIGGYYTEYTAVKREWNF